MAKRVVGDRVKETDVLCIKGTTNNFLELSDLPTAVLLLCKQGFLTFVGFGDWG